MLKLISIIVISFFLHACGGASQHEPREEKTLYFKDAPRGGINYCCGDRTGITKPYKENGITKQGMLKCIYSPITFSLGNLTIGSIDSVFDGQTIRPQDLINNFDGDFSNQELLKIAIILQSLGNRDNNSDINISTNIKKTTPIDSLDKITIEELDRAIRDMGITPVTANEARVHLILNSPNTNNLKPKIEAFEEDISTELMVGSVIGQISLYKGDGELILPFILSGDGAENFLLNSQGKLILTQTLNSAKTYNLRATVTNQFGYNYAPITIHVKESGKIGKVESDSIKNATVKLFRLNEKKELELISTENTNSRGNFELHTELLEDNSYYIYEVSNSKTDSGKLRLITKGIWIKNAMSKIEITTLSEMLYSYIKRDGFDNLEIKTQKYSKILLKKSLNMDNRVDATDIIIFNPLKQKNLLYPTLIYNNTYQKIKEQIKDGDNNYKKTLFNAYIVDSFQSNAIEIVGSSIYTIDMMGSGEFNIYDLDTKEKIGGVKLPNTPFDTDTHVLYVDLIGNEVKISSLEDWSYEVNISNQRKPLIKNSPYIKYSIVSGNFSLITIGKNYNKNIFSNQNSLYFYDLSQNLEQIQKIKFFTIKQDSNIYQYEFNSQLSNINSLWTYQDYLYVIGDNKINIFKEKSKRMELNSTYNKYSIKGHIIGIEEEILYILNKSILTLLDISSPTSPKFIEKITVPFRYKLGIKTNGEYITTGSQIIDIKTLRASKIAK